MIDRGERLPVKRQAELLELSRGSVYYLPKPVAEEDLALMRRIDELHLNYPFAGSRMLRDLLRLIGIAVGRRHVGTLMARMGIEAIYRRANTSRKHPKHPIYPYLLRDVVIERPDHAWASDISYVPMRRGFVYLVAILDWATRKVLSWRLSNTLTADFCVEALQEALARFGKPEIFNTDQGSQFTSVDFTDVLNQHGIRISMDGRGAWRDNVFVERLWRTIKYEEIYLHAYDSVSEAHRGIARYLKFYNSARPHKSLGGVPPDLRYFAGQALAVAA
jgi:putative transposase